MNPRGNKKRRKRRRAQEGQNAPNLLCTIHLTPMDHLHLQFLNVLQLKARWAPQNSRCKPAYQGDLTQPDSGKVEKTRWMVWNKERKIEGMYLHIKHCAKLLIPLEYWYLAPSSDLQKCFVKKTLIESIICRMNQRGEAACCGDNINQGQEIFMYNKEMIEFRCKTFFRTLVKGLVEFRLL